MAIVLLSVPAVLGELRFNRTLYYVPYDAFTTLLLVLGGPVIALVRYLVADVPWRLVDRRLPVASPGAWATYISYGYAALAGSALLRIAKAGSIDASAIAAITAGFAAVTVNWLGASGLFNKFWRASSFVELARDEYLPVLPIVLAQQILAALIVLLIPSLSFAALLPLGLATLLPALALPALARSRDVSLMDQGIVTRLYARALCTHLGLDRCQRRTVLAAVTLTSRPVEPVAAQTPFVVRPGSLRGPLPPAPIGIASDPALAWKAWQTIRQATERWDEADGPDGSARGPLLPVEARLVAVALEWAQLTAAGGVRLPQREAALALEAQAGTRFDPQIVAAVGEIVTVEEQFASIKSFQPRLDLLPVPEMVRRELLPWALQAYSWTG